MSLTDDTKLRAKKSRSEDTSTLSCLLHIQVVVRVSGFEESPWREGESGSGYGALLKLVLQICGCSDFSLKGENKRKGYQGVT